jgi:glucose/arabinose dehydrogenase
MVRVAALMCAAVVLAGCAGSGDPEADPEESASGALSDVRIRFEKIADMTEPIAISQRPDDPTLYVAQKDGLIREVRDGQIGATILDVSEEVASKGEMGFLGFAFNPEGDRFYVYFTKEIDGPDSPQVLREYTFSDGKGTSPRDLLVMDDQYSNHNGGNVMFGPDGYLYVGTGDGGGGGDPLESGQDLESLLGKILRIDPEPSDGRPYSIPEDNPFVGSDGRDEIWAYGLRNPWRWSFDRLTKDLWIGDVGQDDWEEINRQSGDSSGGENYGWDDREGNHRFEGDEPPGHVPPVYEYSHEGGNCSVTGGYVYRGREIPKLRGVYVFADYCGGQVRGFVFSNGRARGHQVLGELDEVQSFAEDHEGNIYAISLAGGVYRIDHADS